MGMGTRRTLTATLAVLAACAGALAAGSALAAASFTAEAVHSRPGQPPETGEVRVSEQGSRFDFHRHGKAMAQIALPTQGVMRVLFPDDRTYFEIETAALPDPQSAGPATPCPPGGQRLSCVKVRSESIGGTAVDVWWIGPVAPVANTPATPGAPPTYTAPPKATTQVWWDPAARLALKEILPDGSASTMTRTGSDTYEGRTVERWETVVTGADGKTARAVRLYDPALATDVREELPDGSTRAFRNIRLVPADPAWFVVPAGYRRIDPPRPPAAPPSAQQPAPR